MLKQADLPISPILRSFTSRGIRVAFLVPTPTGLKKSIVDAHSSLRLFLKANLIHDYESQSKGKDSKVVVPVNLLDQQGVSQRLMSLYRPETKNGDPRLWIESLGNFCQPFNVLVFIAGPNNNLYVANASSTDLEEELSNSKSLLSTVLGRESLSDVEIELLKKLKDVAAKGFVTSLKMGPTGVGFTLETMLGILANSSPTPDFKGIEIKAGRLEESGGKATRTTLLSQVPDWKASSVKSGTELLKKFGYYPDKSAKMRLYCTISPKPNPQGLFFSVDYTNSLIHQMWSLGDEKKEVVQWKIDTLTSALAKKHKQTFWVGASVEKDGMGVESFHYVKLLHTKDPVLENLPLLIEEGVVTMDLTLSEKKTGSAKDHGYLFKIHENDLDLLFPKPVEVSLI